MTLRNTTLTAVAALTLSTAMLWAQDTTNVVVPQTEPATAAGEANPAADQGTTQTPEAAPAPEAETPAPAAEEPVAVEEPAAEAPAEVEVEAEPETPAEPEAPEEAAEPAALPEVEPEAAPAAEVEAPVEEEVAEVESHVEDVRFSFEGPFGSYDQFQLQRGLQVYTESCANCHGLKQVSLRTLGDEGGVGLPEDQVRAYAGEFSIYDAELEDDRPRSPTDHFPAVSGMGMGPDLSLMAKARAGFHGPYGTGINQFLYGIGGPEYIHAILTGYNGEEKEEAGTVFYGNDAFPGGWIAMPPPLSDDLVTYEDGTPATLDQMSMDISAFLMWTAEPKMMARKQVGFVSVLFLILLTSLLYLTNKRIWSPFKRKH